MAITLLDMKIMFGMVLNGTPFLQQGASELGHPTRQQMFYNLTEWLPPENCFFKITKCMHLD